MKSTGFIVLLAATAAYVQGAFAGDPTAEMETAYLKGEYLAVIQHAGADPLDRAWYLVGMSYLQLQQPEEAQQAFRTVLERFPESRWRPDAEVGFAEGVWLAGDPAQAVSLYQTVLSRYGPAHPVTIRAQYQLGQAARAAGQWEVARAALQELVTRAPQSFEAGLAQRLLREEDFAFSVQVGAFGVQANAVRLQQELVRRSYTAAVDRTVVDGRAVHRVRVGSYARREEALEAAQQLRRKGFPAKVVP